MMHESLARTLRVLRAARGITLAEAERLTGVTRETLGALEHGQRGAYTSTLQKIADGYGTTISALLEEEPEVALLGKAEAPQAGRGEIEDVEREVELLGSIEGEILERAEEVRARLNRLRTGPHMPLGAFCFVTVVQRSGGSRRIGTPLPR
jgi:transcriptional regulator with XRE-family HTH domain